MGPRPSLSAGIAVALIALGIAAPVGYRHWLGTRTFSPLDLPVSLSQGRIETTDFYINLREQYFVGIDIDYPFTYKADCPLYGADSVLKTHVTLFREGHVLGQTDGAHYYYIAFFDATAKGHYRLDIDVLSDASCLNAGHPRLAVWTASTSYYALYRVALWLSFIPITGGFGLLIRAPLMAALRLRRRSQTLGISEGPVAEHRRWPPRFPRTKPFSLLPSFGLFYATVLSFLVIALLFIQTFRPIPKGLWVSVLQRPPEAKGAAEIPPIVVRLEDAGPAFPPELYVNSRAVSWEGLEFAVRRQLTARPEWVVYIEADADVPWVDVVSVVDMVRGLQAKAVLLTSEAPEPRAR